MTGAARLSAAIRSPKRAGRPALMPFLTAGFPDRDAFGDLLVAVSRVADAIELGVPFSDPMADGVSIQDASRQAIEQGVSLRWILRMLTERRSEIEAPVVLMSYLNPLFSYGSEDLARDAAAAGACGFIIPDLLFEERRLMAPAIDGAGLGLIQLVTPLTASPRLEAITGSSTGFVYAVTMTGTTGGDVLPSELSDYLGRLKAAAAVPICAGFGIRRAEKVQALYGHADGVIVGTALIDVLREGGDAVAYLEGLLA